MQIELKNRGKEYGVQHLLATKSGPCLDVLAESLGISSEKMDFLLNMGCLYLKEERIKSADLSVQKGDYLRVHLQPRRFQIDGICAADLIIDQCDDYIVVSKPSGLPVHSTVDNIQENLQALLENYLKKEIYVTHRLDVPTSGLMLYACTKAFQRHFNEALASGGIQKIYRALVHGHYQGATELTHYMEISPRAPKKVFGSQIPNSQVCKLRVLDSMPLTSLKTELTLELLTGRTHQIRAQLSHDGYPIVGDLMYGSTERLSKDTSEKIHLQASFLSFPLVDGSRKQYKLFKTPWSYQS